MFICIKIQYTKNSKIYTETISKVCFLCMPELRKLILHLDQKAAKCTSYKWLYGKF